MKISTHFFFVLVIFWIAAGCSKRESLSLATQQNVNIQMASKWIELTELRAVADKHLHSRYADFDPSGAEVTANVHRDATNLVTFQYFRGFGVPVYYVRFDSLGQITFSTNRIATEGPR